MSMRSSMKDAARRAYLTVTRGTLVKADDGKKMQEVMVKGIFDQEPRAVEHIHPYGFTAVPKAPADGHEAEALVLHVNGSQSHPVVIAVGDRRYRLSGLEEGEVAVHDDQGQKVHLGRNGITVETDKTIEAKTGGSSLKMEPGGDVRIVPAGTLFMG